MKLPTGAHATLALAVMATTAMHDARSDHTLQAAGTGFAITVPDGWKHDPSDTFGFLIRPEEENRKKMRIHPTGSRDLPPEEAARLSAAKIREIRAQQNKRQEAIIASEPLVTDSGLSGHVMEIGDEGAQGSSYLTRIYFAAADGRIICVCIYHFGDKEFAAAARECVVRSLRPA